MRQVSTWLPPRGRRRGEISFLYFSLDPTFILTFHPDLQPDLTFKVESRKIAAITCAKSLCLLSAPPIRQRSFGCRNSQTVMAMQFSHKKATYNLIISNSHINVVAVVYG
jgi:hypothetical protein